jgi:hypothetical protein
MALYQPTAQTIEYLKRAKTCVDWAAAQSEQQERKDFLEMAKRWRTMAEESGFIASLGADLRD